MFKKNLAHLRAYDPGPSPDEIKKAYGLDHLVKLDANENVYGSSPEVARAIAQAALLPELYPDCQDSALRQDLAKRLNINENQLLFGLGLDEIIVLVSRAFLAPGDSIVMAWPTFYEYYCHAQIEGAQTRKIPCNREGRHDLQGMLDAIDQTTRVVWICNPNNPTGTYVTGRELYAFVKRVPGDVLIVLDEAYIDFVVAEDFPRSLEWINDQENVLVLRTFSKSYGLASFRIGYAIGRRRVIEEIEKVRPPFNNPRLSQIAAFAALQDQAFKEACVRKNREVLDMTYAFLDRKEIPYFPSQANFIFVKTGHAKAVQEICKRNGYLIQAFEDGVRITIGKMNDMKGLLPVLEQAMNETLSEPSL
ncbi:histidinol-phosphate transaminase [Sporolactobacillus sp. Y61]|uniref:Histidinol-phosphate aminotransferase n=1 Tax=Sporolactobacillus sp. Y61 TaxID=3160863 RepID=A0AAU8IBM1_9BACL